MTGTLRCKTMQTDANRLFCIMQNMQICICKIMQICIDTHIRTNVRTNDVYLGIYININLLTRARNGQKPMQNRPESGPETDAKPAQKRCKTVPELMQNRSETRARTDAKPTRNQIVWTSETARKRTEYFTNCHTLCTELGDRYTELHSVIARGSHATARNQVPTSRPPLRIQVIDEITAISAATVRTVAQFRGTLKLGLGTGTITPADTVKALGWIGGAIPGVWNQDPDTVRDAMTLLRRRHTTAGIVLGINPNPFPIHSPCPDCGQQTLWADPNTWMVACCDPPCPFRTTVDDPALTWAGHTTTTTIEGEPQP